MTFNALLNLTCTIRRKTLGAIDALGHAAETWADSSTGVPCRLSGASGNEQKVGDMVAVADFKCIVGPSVDVTERDRVKIGTVEYDVLLVAPVYDSTALHHKTLSVRLVR